MKRTLASLAFLGALACKPEPVPATPFIEEGMPITISVNINDRMSDRLAIVYVNNQGEEKLATYVGRDAYNVLTEIDALVRAEIADGDEEFIKFYGQPKENGIQLSNIQIGKRSYELK